MHSYTGPLGEVADLLVATEARHHDKGWDGDPVLYRVGRSMQGFTVSPLVLGQLIGRPADEELDMLAIAAQLPESAAIDRKTFPDPPVAHLLVMETWMRVFASTRDRQAEMRRYADIPGSVECRLAIAAMGTHTLWLVRLRDKPPGFLPESAASEPMVDCLVRLHQATLRQYAVS